MRFTTFILLFLISAVVSGTNIVIVYDGDGNRVKKIVGATTNLYLVDDRNPTGYAQVLEEKTVSGGTTNLARLYTYGLDLISQKDTATAFYGYDGNGNTRYLTATNAAVTDTYVYDAFGVVITNTGTTTCFYRYSGEQFDPNLGFVYLRSRYMNPDTDRFLTRDAYTGNIFDPVSTHKYLYAHAEPVDNVDPTGNEIEAIISVLSISSALAAISSPVWSTTVTSGGTEAKTRPLTAGEIELCKKIFGSKIDYSKVKFVLKKFTLFTDKDTFVTPNGNIYASPKSADYRSDYSVEPSVGLKAKFIHEMTHVWQHQTGQNVVLGAILSRKYDYDYSTFGTKKYTDYGIEQQASIVEDYYLLTTGNTRADDDGKPIQLPPIETYKTVLKPYFP